MAVNTLYVTFWSFSCLFERANTVYIENCTTILQCNVSQHVQLFLTPVCKISNIKHVNSSGGRSTQAFYLSISRNTAVLNLKCYLS